MTRHEYAQYKAQERRRENVNFIKRSLITFTVITVMVFGFTLGCSLTANAGNTVNETKYYKEVPVCDGDTLTSIAAANMDAVHYTDTKQLVREIIVTNQLVSDTITSDMVLMIPYYEIASR